MFIDHAALVLCSQSEFFNTSMFTLLGKSITLYFILRKIGRLAFPLFCFLISEGFFYTRRREKYAASLFIFALISEIPYNLMNGKNVFFTGSQNIYFTLFFGVILLYILESSIGNLFKLPCCVAIILIVSFARIDYGLKGVLLIVLLYLLRNKRLYQIVCSLPFLSGGYAAWSAIFLTGLYNNKRGFIKGKTLKYAFYVFYPAHILILLLLKKIIM
jgi:hypothetical protein